MSKTFKVAGITVHDGNAKVRFTDDLVRRIKQFNKGGATRVDFVELPSAMSKVEALQHLLAHASFQSPSDQATLNDSLADRQKEASKGTVKVTAKVAKAKVAAKGTAKKATPSLASIKSRIKTAPVANGGTVAADTSVPVTV